MAKGVLFNGIIALAATFSRPVIGFTATSGISALTGNRITSPLISTAPYSSTRLMMAEHKPPSGHSDPRQAEMSEEDRAVMEKISAHQKEAARLSTAEDIRTLLQYSTGFGVISTISKNTGFPSGSVVGFALEDSGMPVFSFSGISQHTQDLLVDPRCSLTVTSKDFKGAADGRVSITGTLERVSDPEAAAAVKETYMKFHPNAFWVQFGDFSVFRMKELVECRFVGGFARAGSCTPEEYAAAKPDEVTSYAPGVMKHMNDDHADSTVAMVNHFIGVEVEEAEIVAMDRLGMQVKVTRKGEMGKLRLPFVRPIESRKDIKDVIVEMTRASAGAPTSS
eukprot:CAMPEP_0113935316 /NCGR_PEP_ID=MMETSP1339-20121228/2474_1 /TAXON_ID=94617 /ORGANISM="Fibrocapsa japonica" /LENGTH=336 /DNA_ID=CAMNT_0000937413 /DNA_START=44 /DNA_END=1054 /DNA_ORIENTATION=+ /assembly_acc=CAM_ASM_000762